MTGDASLHGDRSLHGAYVARQCPVRLFRERDPFGTAEAAPADDALQALFDAGHEFESNVIEALAELYGDDLVVVPGRDEAAAADRAATTAAAMEQGVRFIAGALLEPDVEGRRLSEVDLLMRVHRDGVAASPPRYWPIDVKSHRATEVLKNPKRAEEAALVVHLDLSPTDGSLIPKRSENDCIQLAHYHRHLEALGYADDADPDGAVWGGVIGSRGLLAWFDLNTPAHTTTTPQVDDSSENSMVFHRRSGKRQRTSLERYDFEFAFRLDVADAADQRASADEPPIVVPVKVKECERCSWREVCDAELRARDDVSLVAGVNYPEWSVHRHVGNPTVAALAALDLDTSAYDDTPITPNALRQQIENARSVQAGGPIVRHPVSIPRGDIEIDFDLECTVNPAKVYLWGALLTHDLSDWPQPSGTFVPFATWKELTPEREGQLVAELWAWLQEQVMLAEQRGLTVRIYGYNLGSTETYHLRRIAAEGAAPGLPTVEELDVFTSHERYVDLFAYMSEQWISNDGHSLKVMAPAHGFAWGDEDPSGFSSIAWYEEALETGDPELIQRILDYNHDDCRATLALRQPVHEI